MLRPALARGGRRREESSHALEGRPQQLIVTAHAVMPTFGNAGRAEQGLIAALRGRHLLCAPREQEQLRVARSRQARGRACQAVLLKVINSLSMMPLLGCWLQACQGRSSKASLAGALLGS